MTKRSKKLCKILQGIAWGALLTLTILITVTGLACYAVLCLSGALIIGIYNIAIMLTDGLYCLLDNVRSRIIAVPTLILLCAVCQPLYIGKIILHGLVALTAMPPMLWTILLEKFVIFKAILHYTDNNLRKEIKEWSAIYDSGLPFLILIKIIHEFLPALFMFVPVVHLEATNFFIHKIRNSIKHCSRRIVEEAPPPELQDTVQCIKAFNLRDRIEIELPSLCYVDKDHHIRPDVSPERYQKKQAAFNNYEHERRNTPQYVKKISLWLQEHLYVLNIINICITAHTSAYFVNYYADKHFSLPENHHAYHSLHKELRNTPSELLQNSRGEWIVGLKRQDAITP